MGYIFKKIYSMFYMLPSRQCLCLFDRDNFLACEVLFKHFTYYTLNKIEHRTTEILGQLTNNDKHSQFCVLEDNVNTVSWNPCIVFIEGRCRCVGSMVAQVLFCKINACTSSQDSHRQNYFFIKKSRSGNLIFEHTV